MHVNQETDTLVARLRALFTWRGGGADIVAWWAHADVLAGLGPALARLHAHSRPSIVIAPEARGFILGPLVATAAGAGFVEMRKGRADGDARDRALIQDRIVTRSTPPDYADRTLDWVVQRRVLRPWHRVLFVDDWVETAATVRTARKIVEDSGATWSGAAAIVDGTTGQAHPELRLRALLRVREL
ncbi:adenine phosphoribosyltransferase [Nonomuraea sp. NN258]|uniref:adenine phosphoribosyltransferase n=1 Tax=Nonomuraea antri TaxID=2730852 RepID=UPI001568E907|nr:adenine phosphoribosyltransferase [Nonomuraea antri]NRQ38769.1 adenine phosphoribosyltransferase [Nonomuraea antri]